MNNLEFRNKIRSQHQEQVIKTCVNCKKQRVLPTHRMMCDECNDDANELQRSYRIGGKYADSPSDCGGY